MGVGAAELFRRHDFVRDGFDDIGSGDEHVGRVAYHEDEVGHCRRVNRAACAGSHNDGDLRDDAGRIDIALEYIRIAGERGHAFLNARAARIVEADHGCAVAHGHIENFADLLRVGFGERAAQHSEVLAKHINEAAIDRTPAGDDAVACHFLFGHAEIGAAMGDEHVEFFERAFVEQNVDAFARGELAATMLRLDARFTAALPRLGAPRLQLFENFAHLQLLPFGIVPSVAVTINPM